MADTLPQTATCSSKGLILMYHRINEASPDPWGLCVSRQHFAEHLEVLRKHVRVVPLQQLATQIQGKTPSGHWATLTFDDGYADNLHNAKPLLERYEIPATVFLATGYIGGEREFWWDDLEKVFLLPGILPDTLRLRIDKQDHEWGLSESAHYSEEAHRQWQNWRGWDESPTRRHSLYHEMRQLLQPLFERVRRRVLDELLTWARVDTQARPTHRVLSNQEVIALDEGGLIEVGAHTVTHPRLSDISLSRQQEEIRESKRRLEELTGHPITSFAYPFGSHSDYTGETVEIARHCGFVRACSTVMNVVHHDTDPLQLPRLAVQNWNGDEFAQQLQKWCEQ